MKKILIVEDEYPVRDVLKIALTENGYPESPGLTMPKTLDTLSLLS